jgi:hypothetical protein
MNEESKSLAESLGDVLTEIPQEELEAVVSMNREQRREWLRTVRRKRGKGYTR